MLALLAVSLLFVTNCYGQLKQTAWTTTTSQSAARLGLSVYSVDEYFGTLNSGTNSINTATLVATSVMYSTNDGSSASIDLTKLYGAVTISGNFTFTSLANVSPWKTNVQTAVRFITNNSGTDKIITFPSTWIGVATTEYITNQSMLSVYVYPDYGTNVVYTKLK